MQVIFKLDDDEEQALELARDFLETITETVTDNTRISQHAWKAIEELNALLDLMVNNA